MIMRTPTEGCMSDKALDQTGLMYAFRVMCEETNKACPPERPCLDPDLSQACI